MRSYIALIHHDPGSDFGISFPDLPGCVTAGTSLEEARIFASEALGLHLSGLVDNGDALPMPSSFEAIMTDHANRDCLAILVRASPLTAEAA